jgi:putative flavoprotein involved in K+ transport
MPPVDVVIVGGGPAGLSCACALGRRGVRAIVIDRSAEIGASWTARYERLHLHTVRSFSGLAHGRIPRCYPRYLSKDQYADYLRAYAATAALDVALGENVTSIERTGGDKAARWMVHTARRSLEALHVVIATGSYAEPCSPRWPGQDGFRGQMVHSGDYVSGRDYRGSRVLVVGLGNSGAEIAADLVEQDAAAVFVAMRTVPPIVTRELFGVLPVQLFGIALTPFPWPSLVDRMGTALRRLAIGDLAPFGIGTAAWGPFVARRPAVIDVGFLGHLKAGAIKVEPALVALTSGGACFADDSEEQVDVVVAATGFETGLHRIVREPGLVGSDGRPLHRSGRPTSAPGLWFLGFDETVRGTLFEARRDSLRLARTIERELSGTAAGTSSAGTTRTRRE